MEEHKWPIAVLWSGECCILGAFQISCEMFFKTKSKLSTQCDTLWTLHICTTNLLIRKFVSLLECDAFCPGNVFNQICLRDRKKSSIFCISLSHSRHFVHQQTDYVASKWRTLSLIFVLFIYFLLLLLMFSFYSVSSSIFPLVEQFAESFDDIPNRIFPLSLHIVTTFIYVGKISQTHLVMRFKKKILRVLVYLKYLEPFQRKLLAKTINGWSHVCDNGS